MASSRIEFDALNLESQCALLWLEGRLLATRTEARYQIGSISWVSFSWSLALMRWSATL